MPPAQTPPALITLILLTAVSTLSLNMFLPSLASIAAELDTSYATISLAIGGHLATTAVIQLIVGPLSDRIGRRPVLLAALLVFTLASVGCALAQSAQVFLAFRMLQGAMISGYALSLAIVRDTTPERAAASLIGYISMAMAIAPMLGPVIGGVLDTAFGWRASFYLYAILGAALLALCWFDLGETKPAQARRTPSQAQRTSDLLWHPLFWAYSLCGAFSVGAFYIFLTGAPIVAQSQFGLSAAQLGVFLGTITAGFVCGSYLAGRFAPRFAPTTMMIAGRLVAALGISLGLLSVQAGAASALLFFGSTVFVGLGNGITMPSCNAAVMSVMPSLAGTAAGAKGALVVSAGALLTTLTGVALPTDAPAVMLLLLMLGSTLAALLAVIWAIRLGPPT